MCMGSHVCSFTANLASVVMNFWDIKWVELLKHERVVFDMHLRYVDDRRLFLPIIDKGWGWMNNILQETVPSRPAVTGVGYQQNNKYDN